MAKATLSRPDFPQAAEEKISPSFERILAGKARNEKTPAVVFFHPAGQQPLSAPNLPRDKRAAFFRTTAQEHMALQAPILRSHVNATKKAAGPSTTVEATPLASSIMPSARVDVTQTTLVQLAQRPEVAVIMPNQRIHLIKPKAVRDEDVSSFEVRKKMTWGLDALQIPAVWEKTKKGRGVRVAVLDTGVYPKHPALDGRVEDFVIVDPLGRRISATPAFDSSNHGTHVCGTVAGGKTADGIAIGVAPNVKLLVGGVLIGDATVSTLVTGLTWAVEQGAHVINMSLGFTYYEPKFAEVLATLIDLYDVVPVCSVGNENHGNTSSPGNVYNAFSAGAVERKSASKVDVTFFSSGASLSFPGQKPQTVTKPDVVAPGVEVLSCVPPEQERGDPQYAYMDGTSMAAPHVSGVVALLRAARPKASGKQIVAALTDTAYHPTGARPDNRWGHGMIRPVEALKVW